MRHPVGRECGRRVRRFLAAEAAQRSAVRGTCHSWMRNIVGKTRERHTELGIWRWFDDDNNYLLGQALLCPIGHESPPFARRRAHDARARRAAEIVRSLPPPPPPPPPPAWPPPRARESRDLRAIPIDDTRAESDRHRGARDARAGARGTTPTKIAKTFSGKIRYWYTFYTVRVPR